VWTAFNTVFASKHSTICAQAVYFLHLTRPSVTWLDSQLWLTACDWVMSSWSAILSTCVGRRRKFGEVSCTECIGQGNDFGLIPMVKMETRNPIERYFGSEFLAICNHCRVMAAWNCKTLNVFEKFLRFFSEKRPLKVKLEADRISFSFSFSARKMTIFYFSAFYFTAENRYVFSVLFNFSA